MTLVFQFVVMFVVFWAAEFSLLDEAPLQCLPLSVLFVGCKFILLGQVIIKCSTIKFIINPIPSLKKFTRVFKDSFFIFLINVTFQIRSVLNSFCLVSASFNVKELRKMSRKSLRNGVFVTVQNHFIKDLSWTFLPCNFFMVFFLFVFLQGVVFIKNIFKTYLELLLTAFLLDL